MVERAAVSTVVMAVAAAVVAVVKVVDDLVSSETNLKFPFHKLSEESSPQSTKNKKYKYSVNHSCFNIFCGLQQATDCISVSDIFYKCLHGADKK